LFKIDPTRSGDVLIEVLGKEFNGVLGCDYFSAYRRYQREFDVSLQFCLAHLCGIRSGSAQLVRSGVSHLTGCGANRLREH
jgi:hypothetical protein